MSPRISVGLPTYNRPEFLALALENLRRQTLQDFEVIISDNASPDQRVRQMCEELSRADSRFRYVRQAVNIGIEANFWFVYREARSPLFMWAADDDLRHVIDVLHVLPAAVGDVTGPIQGQRFDRLGRLAGHAEVAADAVDGPRP